MPPIAKTPEPPYYAVIFTTLRTDGDSGYAKMADRMVELVQQQPGFLCFESVREGLGITVSYWWWGGVIFPKAGFGRDGRCNRLCKRIPRY